MPPMSSLSSRTRALTLRPVFFSRRCTNSAIWAAVSSKAVCTSASITPSRSFFSASNCARIFGSSASRPFSASTRTKFSASADSRPDRIEMKMPAAFASLSFGSVTAARTRSSSPTAARTPSISDHLASAPAESASLKAASAYGRATVLGSAMPFLSLFQGHSCRLIDSSRSACARASTSRRRIFSAPATASEAT